LLESVKLVAFLEGRSPENVLVDLQNCMAIMIE
jgi:hypothetical protein